MGLDNSYVIAILTMRTIPDPEMESWVGGIHADSEFDWDDGNWTKNEKHDVTPEDIESLFDYSFGFVGRSVEAEGREWRGLILGETPDGRRLALIFTRRGNRLRPISCRPMRDKEQREYEARTKEA